MLVEHSLAIYGLLFLMHIQTENDVMIRDKVNVNSKLVVKLIYIYIEFWEAFQNKPTVYIMQESISKSLVPFPYLSRLTTFQFLLLLCFLSCILICMYVRTYVCMYVHRDKEQHKREGWRRNYSMWFGCEIKGWYSREYDRVLREMVTEEEKAHSQQKQTLFLQILACALSLLSTYIYLYIYDMLLFLYSSTMHDFTSSSATLSHAYLSSES